MKKIVALLLALIMLLSLTACAAKEEPAAERVITVGVSMDSLTTLDVWDSDYNVVLQTSDAIFDRLYDKNKDTMELELNLLADWPEISEDGRTYTFKLRDDVKWSDGQPLTAKDVEFTFNYFYDKDTFSSNTWVGDEILGCNEMLNGEADVLEGFKLIDDYTFEITLYEAFTPFESTLATSYFPILPAHLRADAGDAWGYDYLPVGSGPFKVTYFEPGVRVEMVPNELYRGTKPDCDKLVITHMDPATALLEFEAGHIDFCALNSDQIEDVQNRLGDKLYENVVVGGARISLNNSLKPLDDPRVRKAFGMSFDIDSIVDGYYKGTVEKLNGILPKGIPGHNPDMTRLPYDIEGAKALLAEAGYPDGIDLDVVVRSADPEFNYVFGLIQEQAAEAGIRLNITTMDTSAYNERQSANQLMVYMRRIYADYMDPSMYLFNFESTESFERSISIDDPYVDELIFKSSHTVGEEGVQAAKDLDEYLCNEIYAAIPLFQVKKYYLCSDRVEGLFIKGDNMINFAELKVVG